MKDICILQDVTKRYPGQKDIVLGPLSLRIEKGTVTGIRGENGAGKSTLLAIMANTMKPTSGSVTYGKKKPVIGYVPQELSLYESMTGMENLRFWGLAYGLDGKSASARGRELLEQMHLTDKADQTAAEYSGGMKRRLHLASALMVIPDLLLLDEPTAGADSESADIILQTAAKAAEKGSACVIISHRTGELETICSSILLLEKGKIRY